MIKLIIFDFDGVVVNGTNQGYFYCYHQALLKVGVKLSAKEEKHRIDTMWGKGHKSQLKLLLKEYPPLLPNAIKHYEQCYFSDRFQKNINLIGGAYEVLRNLSKRYFLALATGMNKKTLNLLLKKYSLEDFFKKIITIDDVLKESDKKPSPYMISQIISSFNISSSQTIYVGDSKSDVLMANNAGVTAIVVLSGNLTEKQAKTLQVEYIIKDINDLPQLTKKL